MVAGPRFDHLLSMTGPFGLYEHALGTVPRREHGYCLDDAARALVVVAREPDPSLALSRVGRRHLDFTLAALDPEGGFRNRRDADGRWVDLPSTGDHWGRAIWGLGSAAIGMPAASDRERAHRGARTALTRRSPWPRSTAYATLGAAALLLADPDDAVARLFLSDARADLPEPSLEAEWPWPEPRLTYANAVLPEAWLAVGYALDDEEAVAEGLRQLTWLLSVESCGSRLSVTPVGGAGPQTARPGFDQQPIEVAALAEACRRAADITADPRWAEAVQMCERWFTGDNDAGLAMYDPVSGGGFDGLQAGAVNRNQGAESTLAALATLQLAQAVRALRPTPAR